MKAILLCSVMGPLFSGCTEEQSRQFAEGYNQGMEQQREMRCEPGTQCFANLSPQAQQQILAGKQKTHTTCYNYGTIVQCESQTTTDGHP